MVVLQQVSYRQTDRQTGEYLPVCYPESKRGGVSASSCQQAWAAVGDSCGTEDGRRGVRLNIINQVVEIANELSTLGASWG